MTAEFILNEEYSSFLGERLDSFLAAVMEDKTRSAVQKLIAEGKVTVNGKAADKKDKLKPNDCVAVELDPPKPLDALPQDIPLPILYEDDELLVVNKLRGMVVHPAAGNEEGTMVNALLFHCRGRLSSINGVIRPGIVHRIDKDTSGLLLVAKTDRAHLSLAEQIKEHSCERVYHAVVYGNVKNDEGTVSTQLARHKTDRKRMAVVNIGGKNAVTHYRVLKRFTGFSYVECRLETGRTHQIRVHMAHIGYPVAGDPVYGPKKVIASLNGQCLHAKEIAFTHPTTGERLHFDSPLPDYFAAFLNKLENKG